jgi:magnesium chelatase family protein
MNIHAPFCGLDVTVSAKPTQGATKILGLPDAAIKESRTRLESALARFAVNDGTILSLAPCNVKKRGTAFDLPMALAILAAHNRITLNGKPVWAAGEVGLNGEVVALGNGVALATDAQKHGATRIILPMADARQAAVLCQGIDVIAVKTVAEAMAVVQSNTPATPLKRPDLPDTPTQGTAHGDFGDVVGQETAKRAILVAVAGGHNVLMVGPPGAGKTMLASRIPTIMPPLGHAAMAELTAIYQDAGELDRNEIVQVRPFRAPHHSASREAISGGGARAPRPGEVSLAHEGVLFLDEFPEFRRDAVEALREPLESGVITISRTEARHTWPAHFMLVAAKNPCPCGQYGFEGGACTCSRAVRKRYEHAISGPILDRIDIILRVEKVPASRLLCPPDDEKRTTSEEMRERVLMARKRGAKGNTYRHRSQIIPRLQWTTEEQSEFGMLVEKLDLTARGIDKVFRVGRSVADVQGRSNVVFVDMLQALAYRTAQRVEELEATLKCERRHLEEVPF